MDAVRGWGSRLDKRTGASLAYALVLAVGGLTAVTPRAGADTITYMAGTSPAPAGFFPSSLPAGVPANPVTGANLPSFAAGVLGSESHFPQSIALPQFNPSLGILSGVQLDFLTFQMADMTITNLESSASERASGNLSMTLSLGNPAGGALSSAAHSAAVSATIAAGQTALIPAQGFYDLGTATAAVSELWQGAGNVLFPVNFSTQNAVMIAGGDSAQSTRFRGYGAVQVTYTFAPNTVVEQSTETPEPSTLLMVGVALGGFGAYRRFVRRPTRR